MKRFIQIVCCALGLTAPFAHAQTPPLTLCYEDAEQFPWLTKDGKGLSNILLDMASNRSGIKIEQIAQPWKRCLVDLSRGTVDGVIGASYNEERAAFAAYPTNPDGQLDLTLRMSYDTYSVYRLKGTSAGWNGSAFTQLSRPVGTQMGYSVIGDLKKLGVAIDETARDGETVMKMLVLNRYELATVLTLEGDDLLTWPAFSKKIEKIPTALSGKPYFLIFNKNYYANNKKTVEALWAGMALARDSKEFVALRKEKLK